MPPAGTYIFIEKVEMGVRDILRVDKDFELLYARPCALADSSHGALLALLVKPGTQIVVTQNDGKEKERIEI